MTDLHEPETVRLPALVALSTRQLAWRRFRRHRLAMASGVILLLIGSSVLLAGVIAPSDPNAIDLTNTLQPPNSSHPLGTDQLGRDVLSRMLYGGRVSLLVGMSVAMSAGIIGALVGSLAGYFGGWIDNLLMRTTDLFLSIPLLVVLVVASSALSGSVVDIVLILTAFFWMYGARVVRAVFLSLKEKEFVEAAEASGASKARIIFLHLLPNALGPLIVNVTLGVALAVLTESALSFLGFGVQPPTPTWGNLLNEAQSFALSHPWLVWSPGLVILVTVLAVNFLGDGLRDALDPHGAISTGHLR